MYNIILDKLPNSYKGYLIRTDFRIGIQIYSCFNDKDLSEEEKLMISLKLLYGNGIPKNVNLAVEGIMWFLNLGEKNKVKSTSNSTPIMDFNIDSSRIFSGFKSKFGIDLNKIKMHWFEFRYLLMELKDCHMSDVIEIRQKEIDNNMPLKQRIEYRKLKKMYAITDNSDDDINTQKEIINYLKSKRGALNA